MLLIVFNDNKWVSWLCTANLSPILFLVTLYCHRKLMTFIR